MFQIRAVANVNRPESVPVTATPRPPVSRGKTPSGWGRRKVLASTLSAH